MATLISLMTFQDARGSLSVVEKIFASDIKRIFYIYNVPDKTIVRGEHGHFIAKMALICVAGSCHVSIKNKDAETSYFLQTPQDCLILEPSDWHSMHGFEKETVLLVLSDSYFDDNDYRYEQ